MGAASSVGTGDAAGVAQALDKLNAEVQAAGAASPDQLRALRAQLAKLTDATQALEDAAVKKAAAGTEVAAIRLYAGVCALCVVYAGETVGRGGRCLMRTGKMRMGIGSRPNDERRRRGSGTGEVRRVIEIRRVYELRERRAKAVYVPYGGGWIVVSSHDRSLYRKGKRSMHYFYTAR